MAIVKELVIGAEYWTDYPFVKLGDVPYQKVPVRKVRLIKYDGDKYCDVVVENYKTDTYELKAGYLYDKPQRTTADGLVDVCEICLNDIPKNYNHCDNIQCIIELNRQAGGKTFTPNSLPIRCIKADGTMLEHEHGDHPDYIFPVEVEYVGPKTDERYQLTNGLGETEMMDDGWKYLTDHEEHALLYANCSIAVTVYETCSAAWELSPFSKFKDGKKTEPVKGLCLGGHLWEPKTWKITQASLDKIAKYLEEKRESAFDKFVAKYEEYKKQSMEETGLSDIVLIKYTLQLNRLYDAMTEEEQAKAKEKYSNWEF
jgi:hypothetical protein